ncbi:hypothetical protein MCAL160_0109 [Mycoplasmopsis californica HAZ160_1]|uniref:Uncharacterized protein n=2 Tax=Mycoplasmopsis californica TaxID=2113 RepID=A0A059XRX3_9BACT|nr:hypothetical protein [Mycoplasmopsis californica]AIA29750.1 hypothetical protein MCFN_03180 [Mycoplasmopsis californica]BAP00843.1 hypothetical protein MCAL160_0109 [Mycoplasmopsis californica HAZ160_1]BBG40699.1 hypothetical protein MCAL106_0109 [Mycoplasmopsis californica]BBG41293.1 hypothetical protein MCAL106E_0109 [Mycoplasmopsis californica]BBG41886.1 hypothetical protein MCAL106L_0109 [Mycoplasmopsis californica]
MENQFYSSDVGSNSQLKGKVGNKVIVGSIIVFALNLILAIAAGMIFVNFFAKSTKIFIPVFTISLILEIILVIIFFAFGLRMPIYISIPYTAITSIVLGIFILSAISFSGLGSININLLLASLFIPLVAMLILGTLAYFMKINVTFLSIVISVLLVTTLVFLIVVWFVSRSWATTMFSFLGLALMLAYMALDWYLIVKFNNNFKSYENQEQSKLLWLKYSIYFGFRLFYDYIYAAYYIYNLFRG